jgi:hypothetical protein
MICMPHRLQKLRTPGLHALANRNQSSQQKLVGNDSSVSHYERCFKWPISALTSTTPVHEFSNLPLVTSRTPAISSPILTLTEESCCPKPASLWFRLQPTGEMSEPNKNECRSGCHLPLARKRSSESMATALRRRTMTAQTC